MPPRRRRDRVTLRRGSDAPRPPLRFECSCRRLARRPVPVSGASGESPRPATARSGGVSSLLIAAGIFLSRIAGLVRERVIATCFGTGLHADVFSAGLRLPNAVQNLLGEGTLSASFIPVYSELLGQGRTREEARENVVDALRLMLKPEPGASTPRPAPIAQSRVEQVDPASQGQHHADRGGERHRQRGEAVRRDAGQQTPGLLGRKTLGQRHHRQHARQTKPGQGERMTGHP